jgi:hypothetical protein
MKKPERAEEKNKKIKNCEMSQQIGKVSKITTNLCFSRHKKYLLDEP